MITGLISIEFRDDATKNMKDSKMAHLNVVISDRAKKKFDLVKEKLGIDQHKTATIILEGMDVSSFVVKK